MTKKKSRELPAIFIDENIIPDVIIAFRPNFRTFEISHQNKFKGKDEKDYIAELYASNGIFITSDAKFVNYVLDNGIKHAGIVLIPEQMTNSEKSFFADIVCGFIKGGCSSSPFTFRNFVFYPAHDGLRTINKGNDKLEFSWDWLSQMIEND